jgi:RNA polymerase sigma-70 factor (ECF subfamily)
VNQNEGGYPNAPPRIDPDPDPGLDKLLGEVACGDHGAFELVYQELRVPVFRAVRAVLRDPAQSEEVAQEVLLELWVTAVHYDPAKGSAVAWAMMIARRRAIDRVRSAVAATARDQQTPPSIALWDQTHEAAADALDRERLARCLGQLSDPQRQAITLAFYGGHTYNEVAVIVGAPLGTVKGRIRDALLKLRDGMLGGE